MTEIDDVASAVNEYWQWMKDRTVLRSAKNGWVEVNTPFMDRHNDGLQIYVRKVNDMIEMTDDGYIISDLSSSGFNIDTAKRRNLVNRILNITGIEIKGEELTVRTDPKNFPSRKNDLLNAMMQINDLYLMSKQNVSSFFADDVGSWLESREVYSTPNIRLQGKSGLLFSIDFLFSRNKDRPERALQVINRPTVRSIAPVLILKEELSIRKTDVMVMLNDENASERTMDALNTMAGSYGVRTLEWKKRDEYAGSFA